MLVRNYFKELSNEIKYVLFGRELPLCINCKYYMKNENTCGKFYLENSNAYITGERKYYPLDYSRKNYCTIHGHYFEKKI